MVKIQPIFQNSNSPIYVGKIISRWSLKLSFLYTLSPKCFWVLWQKSIKVEIRMKRFLKFFWKNDFLSLFCWVWIKSHFPLFSASSNFIRVLIRYICCFERIRNYWKRRSIIGKQRFDFRSVAKSFMYIRKKLFLSHDTLCVVWNICY